MISGSYDYLSHISYTSPLKYQVTPPYNFLEYRLTITKLDKVNKQENALINKQANN